MIQIFELFLIISIVCLKIQTIYSRGNLYKSDQNNTYYIDNDQKV